MRTSGSNAPIQSFAPFFSASSTETIGTLTDTRSHDPDDELPESEEQSEPMLKHGATASEPTGVRTADEDDEASDESLSLHSAAGGRGVLMVERAFARGVEWTSVAGRALLRGHGVARRPATAQA